MRHVKSHGALYNMAAADAPLAVAIANAVSDVASDAILVGLRVASEVFADRAYESNGLLTPRNVPGAVIDDVQAAVSQVMRILHEGRVASRQGLDISIHADTVCVHGDGVKAVEFARALRTQLDADGVAFYPLSG